MPSEENKIRGAEHLMFTIGNHEFFVPETAGEKSILLSRPQAEAVAFQYYELLLVVKSCYGEEAVFVEGPLAGSDNWEKSSIFRLDGLSKAHNAVINYIATGATWAMPNQHNFLANDSIYTHLYANDSMYVLFVFDSLTSTASSFSGHHNIIRLGLKRAAPHWVKRYDISKTAYPNFMTLELLIKCHQEIRRYAMAAFRDIGQPMSEANVHSWCQLYHARNKKAVRDALNRIPFLQKARGANRKLALLASTGITYEYILVFGIVKYYPKSEEELQTFLELPWTWVMNSLRPKG